MSEIVVYTTIAVVYAPVEVESADEDEQLLAWQPVADGAWTQLHLFLEIERDESEDAVYPQLLRNLRLVAWVLETGKVIVNDVLSTDCVWQPVDEVLWEFQNGEGQCYGFLFRTMDQALECAHVIGKILSNVDEIRRLVMKMFQTRSTTQDFLKLLYDVGFFRLELSRRSVLIESAHAAVASLQSDLAWRHPRLPSPPVYPKEDICLCRSGSSSSVESRGSLQPAPAAAEDLPVEAGIIMQSTAKRSSNHHLLAKFSEVQIAALVATQGVQNETYSDSDSDGASSDCETNKEDSQTADGASRDTTRDPETVRIDTYEVPTPDMTSITAGEFHGDANAVAEQADTTKDPSVDDMAIASTDCISMPYKSRQELHVTYNAEYARFEGLPWAWRRLNHQFGLPLEAVPKRNVEGYSSKIPAVLHMMKECLVANNGITTEGIFRLAPDKGACAIVKQSINEGKFSGCSDVHIMSSLIKVWFRELPQSLFNTIPEKHIYSICELKKPEDVVLALQVFPLPYRDLLYWLLDLMAEVVAHQELNKMTARNMAIVISPNLFSIDSDNPMYALTMSQKVAEFTFALLNARMKCGKQE
ncbi:hypothetical protein Poli38472_003400 [Pythium oligandrum]|uniref:Rho-GAP domain-containing protein n=1 Tax=Pythium oligandrum TaxID=41045 RepID=A0A8K1C6R4_PYTOL|nr:hypothetical protein Poli38472_003400 [Pythium oligandrum]|eukprot:TMW57475.1 hypothetical protein Poli38472_003400 [Pythium oligandrum]